MGLTGGKNIFPVVSLGVPHYIIIREAIMINNKALSENEIKMLSFFTDKIEWQRDDIIYQINHAEIRTECSPYFYICLLYTSDAADD